MNILKMAKRNKIKKGSVGDKMVSALRDKPGRTRMSDAIRKSPLAKSSKGPEGKHAVASAVLEDVAAKAAPKDIRPGEMLWFRYDEPITEEDLEYYDARPLTIFFSVVNTESGRRVLGWNMHYYPPKLRRALLDWFWTKFRKALAWDGLSGKVTGFDYKAIMKALKAINMEFGIRMYDPGLMREIRSVPPKIWEVAAYTEGEFEKETRANILKYWDNKRKKI
jgi:hypothetical protein